MFDGKFYRTPAHEVYDPAANRWTALAYVPTARDHLALAALGGRLYAVGGRVNGDYSRNLAFNEAYDSATNRWEQRAPMPTARSGIAGTVLEGRIFVFGGEAPAGTFNEVEAYNPGSDLREVPASCLLAVICGLTATSPDSPGLCVDARPMR
jgi:N-acetylneuraminic acid mutarotase